MLGAVRWLILAALTGALSAVMLPVSLLARETVAFSGGAEPGTIVVRTNERKLSYVVDRGRALRYPVGVGRAGKQWFGTTSIATKTLQPAWSPPAEIDATGRPG